MARGCFDDTKVLCLAFTHWHDCLFSYRVNGTASYHSHSLLFKGVVMVKNLSARDPSALGLDTYCKQYYLCLAAASATIKW